MGKRDWATRIAAKMAVLGSVDMNDIADALRKARADALEEARQAVRDALPTFDEARHGAVAAIIALKDKP